MTRFRPHRGSLNESMALVREVASRDALQRHLDADPVPLRIVSVAPYGFDRRIGWQTHIVLAQDACGDVFVAGFTDGPL